MLAAAGQAERAAGLSRPAVPAKNSVWTEIIDVGSLLLLSFPLPCLPYSFPTWATLGSCFRTRAALHLEILAYAIR